jgi:predicted KAP-like P-loop ATPase
MVEEGLIEALFIAALRQFRATGDLFWQVRALEELGWEEELRELILQSEEQVEGIAHPMLRQHLERAKARMLDEGTESARQ